MSLTGPPPRFPWARFAAYTAVLTAGFAFNLYCVPAGVYWPRDGWRVGAIGYDSDLVINRLHEAAVGTAGPFDPLTV